MLFPIDRQLAIRSFPTIASVRHGCNCLPRSTMGSWWLPWRSLGRNVDSAYRCCLLQCISGRVRIHVFILRPCLPAFKLSPAFKVKVITFGFWNCSFFLSLFFLCPTNVDKCKQWSYHLENSFQKVAFLRYRKRSGANEVQAGRIIRNWNTR